MEDFTDKEIGILLFLVRNRVKYESRRQRRIIDGQDIQNTRVRELADIMDKLQTMKLSV